MEPAAARTVPLDEAFRHVRTEVRGVFAISCFVNLLALTTSVYMLQVFDRVLTSRSYDTLGYLTLIAVAALAVLAVLEAVRKSVLGRAAYWFEAMAAPRVVAAASEDRSHARRPAATLKDVTDARRFLASDDVLVFLDAPWLPVFVGFLFILHPWLGAIGLIGAGLLFACAVANDLVTRRQAVRTREENAKVEEAARELEGNGELLRALGMMRPAFSRWRASIDGRVPAILSMLDTGAAIAGLSRFIRLGLQVLILGAGAYLVLGRQLTPGGMIAGSIILARALAPVERSIQGWRGYRDARLAYSNLKALGQRQDHGERTALPEPRGQLDVETVRFTPKGAARPTLRRVSFALTPGEALGIAGPSGAGKSTLCRLLVGVLSPDFGHVRLDGAGLAEHIDQLGPRLGYVPQDVTFLAGSVAENIARFAAADSRELVNAARLAGVHEMVLSLQDGYETDLGAYGVRLSGGQRQRIALARALYGGPRLLVLDEPGSNLDGEGQQALIAAIAAAKSAGTTVVLVSHQAHLLRICDKMMVLRDGVATAYGPRDQVMARLGDRRGHAQAPATVS